VLKADVQKTVFDIPDDDHVVELRATSENGLLCSLELGTMKKRKFKAMGSDGPGWDVKEFNLRGQSEVLIGFQGKLSQTAVESLTAYTWKVIVAPGTGEPT
jgi:hypothetical protein